MFYLYLVLAFIAGIFFAIGAGAFISFIKIYEHNRNLHKRHR